MFILPVARALCFVLFAMSCLLAASSYAYYGGDSFVYHHPDSDTSRPLGINRGNVLLWTEYYINGRPMAPRWYPEIANSPPCSNVMIIQDEALYTPVNSNQ